MPSHEVQQENISTSPTLSHLIAKPFERPVLYVSSDLEEVKLLVLWPQHHVGHGVSWIPLPGLSLQ